MDRKEPDEKPKASQFSIMWKHAADVLDSDVADVKFLDFKRIQSDTELNGKFKALLESDEEYQRAKQEWTEYWSRKFKEVAANWNAAKDDLEAIGFHRPEALEDLFHLARVVEIDNLNGETAASIYEKAVAWADRQRMKARMAAIGAPEIDNKARPQKTHTPSAPKRSKITSNWQTEFSSLQADCRDAARSYPKLFLARLIAPIIGHDLWQLILGDKRLLRISNGPLEHNHSDQICVYSDIAADQMMCEHALQQFDLISRQVMAAVGRLPDELQRLIGLEVSFGQATLDWEMALDKLATVRSVDGPAQALKRQQFRLLKGESDDSQFVRFPLIAYMNMDARPGEDAFEHRWLATLSPDICTCSSLVIGEIIKRLPDPNSEFVIKRWTDTEGTQTTWTVYDDETANSLDDVYGAPVSTFATEVDGVSGTTLIDQLDQLATGSEEAANYHKHIAKILQKLFVHELSGMRIEREINEGRKRVDICFDNIADKGFFYDLKVDFQVKCPVVFVECKNYSQDPANPEVDQLLGRFGKQRGKFGLLICRKIDDRKKLLARCRDAIHDQGYVIALADEDIKTLWKLGLAGKSEEFRKFLRGRMNDLVL